MEPLVKFLRQHVPLRHLFLNNNGLGPHAGVLIAEALTELARRKKEARSKGQDVPDLETVVCGRNRLESGSAAAWAKAYQAHPNVKIVRMVQNGIRPDGVVSLIRDGLANCKKLQVLDLQDNTFTVNGSMALANAVRSFPDIEELGISDAYLKARGASVLMNALSKGDNKALKTIKLQYAEMNKKGLKLLVTAIGNGALPALQRVELNGNKIPEDDESIAEIRQLLDERRTTAAADEDDETWGIDELDEMESDDEEEEEEEIETGRPDSGESAEDKHDREKLGERVVQEADQAQSQPVAEKKEKDVDDLADALSKTEI